MKKKLLAVVLSVVMIAALLVPMMAISAADTPTAKISLGTPAVSERDFDEDGVAEATVLGVPVLISENTSAFFTARYQVLSNDGLVPHTQVFDAGTDWEYSDPGVDAGDFEQKAGKNTIALNCAVGYAPDGTDKTGFQLVQDSNSGTAGISTASGTIAIVYFVAPTTPGTYTFELVWMDGTDVRTVDGAKVTLQYEMTVDPATATYTVECTEHKAGEPVVTDATCDKDGSKVVSCTACGAEMSKETIKALGHEMIADEENSKAATCIEEGVKATKCSRCDYKETETIEKVEHDWDNGVAAENVKCGETADTTFTCEVCGETRVETGAKLEHDIVDDEANSKDATCTEDGIKAVKCSREGCDYTDSEVILALGHDMVADAENTKAATCTEEGAEATKCSRCDKTESKVLEALGHDMVADAENSKPATCTEEGAEATKCSRCDKTDSKVIEALGHTEGEFEVTKEATCTEAGEKVAKCTVCKEVVKTEAIEALGHTEGAAEVTKEATCIAKGEKAVKCTVCKEVLKTEEIEMIPHNFAGNKVVTVKPTADAKGEYEIACVTEGCTEVEKHEIAKLEETKEILGEDDKPIFEIKADSAILPEDLDVGMSKEDGKTVLSFVSEFVALEGKVEIKFPVALSNANAEIKLVAIDAEGKEVEVEYTFEDGFITFAADLANEYAISEILPEQKPEDDKSETDPNGDTVSTVVFAVVALIAVAGLVVVGKKRFAL